MGLTPEQVQRAQREYNRIQDSAIDVLVDALCDTIQQVTGRKPSDRLRDELFQAVRFN